jgi:hypothetical protein
VQLSAELRWFWDADPGEVHAWFLAEAVHGCAAGGGEERTDEYGVDPGQTELRAKVRGGGGGGVEVKGLVAVEDDAAVQPPFRGPVEVWAKWRSEAITLPRRVVTVKLRRLRKLDTTGQMPVEVPLGRDEQPLDSGTKPPPIGCNVELTRVRVEGGTWWTLGFEAFGDLATVRASLVATADLFAARRPPALGGGRAMSYPAWLAALAANAGRRT